MPKFFPGLTHAIVKTPTNAEMMTRMGGALAMVRLCFTTDTDFLLIRISKMTGPVSGVVADLPTVPGLSLAGIQGQPADELKMAALIAFDKVKQKFGIKFGKQFKVISNDITEIGLQCPA
jgi:hypothetical protein